MKQFLYTIILITFFGFNTKIIEAKETIQGNCIINSASENHYIFCSSDFFTHTAGKENWQYSFQRIFPKLFKLSANTYLSVTKTGLLNSACINQCIVKSEYQITRFEGVDIIHPFNYFW